MNICILPQVPGTCQPMPSRNHLGCPGCAHARPLTACIRAEAAMKAVKQGPPPLVIQASLGHVATLTVCRTCLDPLCSLILCHPSFWTKHVKHEVTSTCLLHRVPLLVLHKRESPQCNEL